MESLEDKIGKFLSDGDGYGDGSGSGIIKLNGERVYMINDVPTIIRKVHGNYAKGAILCSDLTLEHCFIAKRGGAYFAHGETLHDAVRDADAKCMNNMPLEERIALFNKTFPSDTERYRGHDFFAWHHTLTGSCEMGRRDFCKSHGVSIDAAYTVKEFLELCKDAYGGDVIRQLYNERFSPDNQ